MEVLLVLLYAPLGHPHSHPLYGRGGPQSGMERGTRGDERREGVVRQKAKQGALARQWVMEKSGSFLLAASVGSSRVGWPLLAVGMSTNDDFSLPLVFSQTALDQDQRAVCYSFMQSCFAIM